jgi:hypothetical protein
MTYIPESLRREVYTRAAGRCEYCRLNERYEFKRFEIDHVYAEKHGGETEISNLCLSCFECNRYKGSDLCSLDTLTGEIQALFHPRRHVWEEHFQQRGALIEPLTASGRVTVRLLRLNEEYRMRNRERLIRLNRYP